MLVVPPGSGIVHQGDVVDNNKRAAVISWMTSLFSASHVLGNLLARSLPEKYIFEVSVALLLFCPVYMIDFLVETVKLLPKMEQRSPSLHRAFEVVQERYKLMRYAATIVITSPTLTSITLVSFFYELGMPGISSVLLRFVHQLITIHALLIRSTTTSLMPSLC